MLSLSDIVNVKVGIGRGVFEAPGATVIGGKKPSFNLEILKLFANGEQGFWYDPNDMGTMFQDAAGTVPVTAVGQPVGLLLDKRKGSAVGVNLHTTATPINKTYYPGTGTRSDLDITVSHDASEYSAVSLGMPTVVGKTYLLELIAPNTAGFWVLISDSVTNDSINRKTAISNAPASKINTKISFVFTATASMSYIHLNRGTSAVGSVTFKEVSVREVVGNHAYQTTSASRPILRQNATTGAYYLEFDGTDDFLVVSSHKAFDDATLIAANKLRKAIGNHPVYSKAQGGYLYLADTRANVQRVGDSFYVSNNTTGDVQSVVYDYNGNSNGHLVTLTTNSAEKIENAPVSGLRFAGEGFIGCFSSTATAYAGIDLYGIMVIEKVMPRTDIDTFRQHYNKRLGVTLNV